MWEKTPSKITAFSNTCIRKNCPSLATYAMWRLIYNKTCNGLLNVLHRWRFWQYHCRPKAEIWSACFWFCFFHRMASHYFLLLWLVYFYWWMTFTLDPKSHANHNEKVWNLFIIKYYYSNFWIRKNWVFFS